MISDKRKKNKRQPDLMDRTRAAVCFVNAGGGTGGDMDTEMYAFLSLFHPEMNEQKKRELCRKP